MKRFLFVALAALIILRLPSLFEPHWYGDEGIYAAITYGMENGKQLYTELWDNKPPLIYHLYSLGNAHNRLLVIRLLNLVAGFLSIIGLWKIMERLKISEIGQRIGIMVAVFLLGTPVIEINIANGENFFVPLGIFAYLALLQKKPRYFLGGILFGLGFLVKFHPLFDFAAAGLFLLLTKTSWKKLWIFAAGFISVMAIQFGILFLQGNVNEAISIIFFNNFGYTQSYSHGIRSLEFRTAILLVALLLSVWVHHVKRISQRAFFFILVTLFELYGAFFGGREYTHYLIQLIPAATLLVALAWDAASDKNLIKKIGYAAGVWLIFFCVVRAFYYGGGQGIVRRVPEYYDRFFAYARHDTPYFLSDIDERLEKFNEALVPYDKKDVYVYTNNAWTYDVLEIVPPIPVVAGYHRTFVGEENFIKMLTRDLPGTIVVDDDSDFSRPLADMLEKEYVLGEKVGAYQFWLKK